MTLTKREAEVASHISSGLTNKQIARELSISPYTARNHVRAILAKCGLQRRSAIGRNQGMTDYTKPCFIDGNPVRILCMDRPGTLKVVAMDEQGNIYCRKLDGTHAYSADLSSIQNAPERTSWFYRIYRDQSVGASWPTLAEARKFIAEALATLEIEYEDGLPVSAKLHPAEEGK